MLQLSARFALWTEAPTAQVVWRCTLKGPTSGEQSVMTTGMTLTLPLSVTSLARLLLEQGKIPLRIAGAGEGVGGERGKGGEVDVCVSCPCVPYICCTPCCVYCILFFV